MKAKKTVYIFILSIITTCTVFFSALYIYDPLQLFHKHWIGKPNTLIANMRQQAAGIINNYEFDSVIIGTSMVQNTSSKEASQVFGGKFINIALAGSDFYERSFLLNYIFKKYKIKKVLYSLDLSGLINAREGHRAYHIDTFKYLYDDNPFNDFNAYLNDKYLKCLLTFSSSEVCVGKTKTLDRPNSWHTYKSHIVRYGGLDNWFKAENNDQVKAKFKHISTIAKNVQNGKTISLINIENRIVKSKKYINKNLIFFVEKHPKIEFILFLPPYSRIRYATHAQYNKPSFEMYKLMAKYLVEKSNAYPNMKIYGWGNHSFIDDIANYEDPSHYEYKINTWMLSAIKRDEGLLTTENIDNYLKTFTQKALDYNLFELGNKIDEYLKKVK